jgi:hypothetical protein
MTRTKVQSRQLQRITKARVLRSLKVSCLLVERPILKHTGMPEAEDKETLKKKAQEMNK